MRILWLKTELLHPIDKGGKIRTYHMLKELKKLHHITYLTLDDGTAASDAPQKADEYSHEIIRVPHRTRRKFTSGFYVDLVTNLVSTLPYFIKKYKSSAMRYEVARRHGHADVLVCDFLVPSINVPPRLSCPSILFQHNVEAAIWRRHYEVQRNPLKKAYLYRQWRKTSAFERSQCQRFDHVIAVSSQDSDTMKRDYGIASVTEIATGVDTSYFKPSGREQPQTLNLVFTGSMDWLPNQDAMAYFCESILPRIRRRFPSVTLTIVGRDPAPWLLDLSRRDRSIAVTGRVDDVRPYIERSAAYVVPLRIGGGTRLKIYEAMSMGKPIVSTTVGGEGLPIRDGVDLLLADDPDSFSDAVVRVLTDGMLAQRLGQAASAMVEQYSWTSVAAAFASQCEEVVRGHVMRRS